MSVRNLDSLLRPSRVAVIGAGSSAGSVGHIVLRNLIDADYEGVVYPINPRHESVHGIHAYRSIGETPSPVDLAVVCTPAQGVPEVVRECGEAGIKGVCILSAGFRETGPEGAALERRVAAEAARFDGLRILGPNCLGLLVPRLGLNASFASTLPRDGHVAFITQSGALATAVMDWAAEQHIGFSHVISLGNVLDVDLGDLIDYLAEDTRTTSIVLYVESVTRPRKFMSAARAFSRRKPIVAFKSGRFAESAQAAVSHTGAMAGADAVYDAAFERAGIVRVDRIADVFATAGMLSRERPPAHARLAIVTNAGGPGVMAADALLARGGELATLAEATIERLDGVLPPSWSRRNPVDVLGDAPPERFGAAVRTVLADEGVDAVLVVLTPQAMTDPTGAAEAVVAARGGSRKPVLAAWLGGAMVREGRGRLGAGGVAAFPYPEQAVDAFMDLVAYKAGLETLYETPRTLPVSFALDRDRVRDLLGAVLAEGDGLLSEATAKTLLDAYEIPVTKPLPAHSPDAAASVADGLGYPVVLKIRSPDITHKSDVGGVAAALADAAEVRRAYDEVLRSAAAAAPEARLDGVSIQRMVSEPGYELLVGARRDPTFGAVIVVGAGGTAAEVLGDVALGLPPLNERLARRMLESLRIWPLLRGHRGRPGVDLDALLGLLIRFSYLVADYPEIVEIEANPVLATQTRAIALDARAVVDETLLGRPPARYSHLAIRPYPEEYTRHVTTRTGLEVTLRSIKPEDEPLWHDMLDAASPESIRARFRGLVKHTHVMATRYCFTDYDRELAIVAEVVEDGVPKLTGVGRLVADADRHRAEYAAFVSDPWQGQGISNLLTAYCLELAPEWGVQRVWAETERDNARMIKVMERNGFAIRHVPDEGLVVGEVAVASAPAPA